MRQPTMQPRIRKAFSGATFIQLWHMRSAHEQQEWLGAMHRNIHLLQRQPGFGSMSLHTSLDGRNIVVYAKWDSEAELETATSLPEVKAARKELDSHGEPDGTLFMVDSVYVAGRGSGGTLAVEVSEGRLVFVNLWTVSGEEQQEGLLAAMKEEAPAIVSNAGSRGMALHKSLNGMRIAVYALWESIGAVEAAVSHNAEAQESRERLGRFGESRANTYHVESVNVSLL